MPSGPPNTIDSYPLVKKSGQELDDTQASALAEVIVDLDTTRPGMFILRFLQTVAPDSPTDVGMQIGDEVEILESSTSTTLIKGEVTSVEADFGHSGQRITVRGHDKSHRLCRARKYRRFNNVSDSDIVSQLVGEAGLTSGVVDTTSQTHTFLAQVHQTDWEFLKWRAEENGLTLDCADGSLNFRKQATETSPVITLQQGVDLLAFRPRISAPLVASVHSRSWDEKGKQVLEKTVGSLPSSDAASLGSDPSTLAAKFGSAEHLSNIRSAEATGDTDALADALAARFADSFIDAEAVCYGSPLLVPGELVTISNTGSTFDGNYRITAAKHIFNAHQRYNVHMRFSGLQDKSLLALTNSNGNGQATRMPRIEGVIPAIVTNTNDPDLRCRVQVKFPSLDDTVQTDWCRTMHLGAGPDHGWMVLPEVGDEVLVAFEQGDFRKPYILGGLYNGQDKPTKVPYKIDGGAVDTRGFASKTGHTLIFDEASSKKGIHLLTADSNFEIYLDQQNTKITIDSKSGKVEIHGAQDVSVKSDADINIEATGTLSMKGTGGVTIESSASASFKATGSMDVEGASTSVKGSGTLDLEADGMATLKGSLVKIN